MSAHERAVEAQEIVSKFAASQQYGPMIRLMTQDAACFTQGGRINCAAIARQLSVPAADVRDWVNEIRATRAG